MKLLFVLLAPAPAVFGFVLGYLVGHPEAKDWRDAAIAAPVSGLLWVLSVFIGLRWRRRASEPLRTYLLPVLIASAVLGLVVLVMEVGGALA